MNFENVLSLGGAAAALVVALAGSLDARAKLKANRPKTDAEADLIQAQMFAANLESQGATVDRLTKENGRLAARVTDMDRLIAELSRHNDDLTRSVRSLTHRMEEIDHALDDAHEQLELMESEVKAANLRAEAAEKRAEQAEAQNKLLREQNRILIAHFKAVDEWVRKNYDADHPGEKNGPPELLQFEPVSEQGE